MITHPEKLMFPDDGITKGELAAYYEMIAPYMLPHLRGRPITMERYHRGIGAKGFFQKDVTKGFPKWLERVEVPKKGGTVHHPACERCEVAALAGQSEHRDAARVDVASARFIPPGRLRIRPRSGGGQSGRGSCRRARTSRPPRGARIALLGQDVRVEGLPYRRATRSQSGVWGGGTFAHQVGKVLVSRDPSRLTQEFSKADRGGRILVDTGRNGYSATFAAAYAVRAKPGAPVSAPCTWEEMERGDVAPRTFTLRTMAARIAAVGDLWADMSAHPQSIRGRGWNSNKQGDVLPPGAVFQRERK